MPVEKVASPQGLEPSVARRAIFKLVIRPMCPRYRFSVAEAKHDVLESSMETVCWRLARGVPGVFVLLRSWRLVEMDPRASLSSNVVLVRGFSLATSRVQQADTPVMRPSLSRDFPFRGLCAQCCHPCPGSARRVCCGRERQYGGWSRSRPMGAIHSTVVVSSFQARIIIS